MISDKRGREDTWQVTCDTCHMVGGLPSFKTSAPKLWFGCLDDSEQKYDLINQWMNKLMTKVVNKPAIPGLLNII